MISLKQLWDLWRRFFFQSCSPYSLAVFRIFFGLVVLESALINLPEVPHWYGVHGLISLQLVKQLLGNRCLDILLFLPANDLSVWLFYSFYILCAALVCCGFMTRFSSVGLYLCITTLQFRNPIINNNGDDLMRVFALFLMFSSAGAALSVDFLIKKKKSGKPDLQPEKISPWPIRFLQLQMAIGYFLYFWTKTMGSTWLDGTAVYYVLHNFQLEHFAWPLDKSNMLISKLLTWGTLLIEFFLWNLIWIKELRYYMIVGALLLHGGLELTLNIPVFQHVIFCGLLLFVFPEDMERAVTQLLSMTRAKEAEQST